MLLTDEVSLAILFLGIGAQVYLRSYFVRHHRLIWYISVAAIFGIAFYWSFLQYDVWQKHPLSKFLLPPYQSLTYYLQYVGTRIVAPWTISLLAALLLSELASRLNRRYGERFFEREETGFLALGLFLSGYPGFIFYILLLLTFELLFSMYYTLRGKGRAPLYYFWFPLSISAILIKNWLLPEKLLTFFNL